MKDCQLVVCLVCRDCDGSQVDCWGDMMLVQLSIPWMINMTWRFTKWFVFTNEIPNISKDCLKPRVSPMVLSIPSHWNFVIDKSGLQWYQENRWISIPSTLAADWWPDSAVGCFDLSVPERLDVYQGPLKGWLNNTFFRFTNRVFRRGMGMPAPFSVDA